MRVWLDAVRIPGFKDEATHENGSKRPAHSELVIRLCFLNGRGWLTSWKLGRLGPTSFFSLYESEGLWKTLTIELNVSPKFRPRIAKLEFISGIDKRSFTNLKESAEKRSVRISKNAWWGFAHQEVKEAVLQCFLQSRDTRSPCPITAIDPDSDEDVDIIDELQEVVLASELQDRIDDHIPLVRIRWVRNCRGR